MVYSTRWHDVMVIGTPVAAERDFSQLGDTRESSRRSLNPEKTLQMTFLARGFDAERAAAASPSV